MALDTTLVHKSLTGRLDRPGALSPQDSQTSPFRRAGGRLRIRDSAAMTGRGRRILLGALRDETPGQDEDEPKVSDQIQTTRISVYKIQPPVATDIQTVINWTANARLMMTMKPLLENFGSTSTFEEITTSHTEKGELLNELYENHRDLTCSIAFQPLQLASRMCEEVETEFMSRKSKKPLRLSTTSWDLFD